MQIYRNAKRKIRKHYNYNYAKLYMHIDKNEKKCVFTFYFQTSIIPDLLLFVQQRRRNPVINMNFVENLLQTNDLNIIQPQQQPKEKCKECLSHTENIDPNKKHMICYIPFNLPYLSFSQSRTFPLTRIIPFNSKVCVSLCIYLIIHLSQNLTFFLVETIQQFFS